MALAQNVMEIVKHVLNKHQNDVHHVKLASILKKTTCLRYEYQRTKCNVSSINCFSIISNKFLYDGDCIDLCSLLGTGFGTPDEKVCEQCKLDLCLSYDEAFRFVISDPINLIKVCIPCEVHGCVSCGKDGHCCSRYKNVYQLIDGKCIHDETSDSTTPICSFNKTNCTNNIIKHRSSSSIKQLSI